MCDRVATVVAAGHRGLARHSTRTGLDVLEVVGAVLGKNDVCLLHDGLKLDRHFNADGQVLIIKHRYQGLGV